MRDDGLLLIVSARALDASELTSTRAGAIGTDEESRGQRTSVVELDSNEVRMGRERHGLRRHEQADVRQFSEARQQGVLDERVLDDVTELVRAELGAVEADLAARRSAVPDLHALVGAEPRSADRRPGAGEIEQALRRRRDGRHAQADLARAVE